MAINPIIEAVGPTYRLDDKKAGVESSINCLPKRLQGQRYMLESSPGAVAIATLTGECRGSTVVRAGVDRWFAVVGNGLYEMNSSGSYSLLGTIGSATGMVSMANSLTQLVIVDGPNLYVFNLSTNVLTNVSSTGWRGSDTVVELDGYFIFADPGTDQFYISDIDNALSLDELDFSSADAVPDSIVALAKSHHQLLIAGKKSCEIWVNSGGADFPFTRYNSYPIDIGCVGPHAICEAADTLYFVGSTDRGTAVVYEIRGNKPTPVSNTAIEEILLQSTDLSKAEVFAYQPKGHEFVLINAPGMTTTLVYDAREKMWHEDAEWVSGAWEPLTWRFAVSFGTEHYGGDKSGAVFRIDPAVNTRMGRMIKRERTWPHFGHPTLYPVSYRGIEVDMDTGGGTNAVVTLEVSNDGGTTFGSRLQRSLGAAGRRINKIRWTGLGAAQNRVFRLGCTDDAPFKLYAATVEV